MVELTYFSDLLCVWAYLAQIKLEAIRSEFGKQCHVDHRYVTLFGNTQEKLVEGWAGRGGISAYAQHVHSVAERFADKSLHSDLWIVNRPASSAGIHVFLAAVRLLHEREEIDTGPIADCEGRCALEEVEWQLRKQFFRHARDIADERNQWLIAETASISVDAIRQLVATGEAFASLDKDNQYVRNWMIAGSPTYVLNEGRQKLYGNVGYKIIQANIRELLEKPDTNQASWC